MNIGDAKAAQVVLQYLLQDENDPLVPDAEQACAAASELAERSRLALSTGMSGEQVRQAWPHLDWPAPNTEDLEKPGTAAERMAGPVHSWFELSYSSYLVLPRVLMHSMPLPWQQRMVACLEELRAAFGHVEQAPGYDVQPCDWAAPHDVSDAELRAARVEVVDEDGETVYYRDGDQLDPHVTCVPVPAVEPLPQYRRGFVQPWPVEAAS